MSGDTIRRVAAILAAGALVAALATITLDAPASAAKPKCGGKVATIVGTNKGEIIKGTAKADVIVARGGHDKIYGKGGNDTICAGLGHDTVFGGPGVDRVFGQPGRDKLYGGPGPDFLAGQLDNDTLVGGIGVDTCHQGPGTGLVASCERPLPPPPPTKGELVVGGSGSGQIGLGGYRWYDEGRDRGPWQIGDECLTGLTPDYEWDWEDRFAMEFPLWGLPAGASVTKATLAIRTLLAPTAGHAIYGYAGNGRVDLGDMWVGGTPVTLSAGTSDARTSTDVTSLLTPAVLRSGWAGFSVRNEPLGFPSEEWACPPVSVMHPILTIEYTVP